MSWLPRRHLILIPTTTTSPHLITKRQLGLDRRLRVLPFSMRNWASPAAVRVRLQQVHPHRIATALAASKG